MKDEMYSNHTVNKHFNKKYDYNNNDDNNNDNNNNDSNNNDDTNKDNDNDGDINNDDTNKVNDNDGDEKLDKPVYKVKFNNSQFSNQNLVKQANSSQHESPQQQQNLIHQDNLPHQESPINQQIPLHQEILAQDNLPSEKPVNRQKLLRENLNQVNLFNEDLIDENFLDHDILLPKSDVNYNILNQSQYDQINNCFELLTKNAQENYQSDSVHQDFIFDDSESNPIVPGLFPAMNINDPEKFLQFDILPISPAFIHSSK